RLMIARSGDRSGVNLRVAGICERGSLLICAIDRRDVATACIGREEEHVGISAGGENHGVRRVSLELSGDEIASDDARGSSVDHNEAGKRVRREHSYAAEPDLPAQGRISTEEQLLSGLPARVKGPRDLRAAERSIRQRSAVFTSKRNALRDAL